MLHEVSQGLHRTCLGFCTQSWPRAIVNYRVHWRLAVFLHCREVVFFLNMLGCNVRVYCTYCAWTQALKVLDNVNAQSNLFTV